MMRARSLPLLLVALATAPLLAGCGAQAASQADSQLGTRLTVFSSLPLTGPEAAAGQQILDGERLALGQAHSRAGRFTIGLHSLNDAGSEGATGGGAQGASGGGSATANGGGSATANGGGSATANGGGSQAATGTRSRAAHGTGSQAATGTRSRAAHGTGSQPARGSGSRAANATGSQAAPGTGSEGAKGATGAEGAKGVTGAEGAKGTTGSEGANAAAAGSEAAWGRGQTASNATLASRDRRTIAYIGDYNSGATAISLPLTNQAGILQISPRSPYVGLTSSFDAGQGDPERFYPTESRNFVRLLPGDPVQGAAQVALMQRLGVSSVYLLNDGEPFRTPLASIVGGDAKQAGIKLAGEETVELSGATGESHFSGVVEAIMRSGAQAVFFSGDAGEGAAALWRDLYAANPQLLLLGTSEMAEPSFTSAIGAAGTQTYLTTPVLPTSHYSRRAQQVLSDFRRRYHAQPTSNVLYGYASMEMVIDAIRSAGATADERQAVIESVFATHDRGSVLGGFSVLGDGETTIARYAVDRVHAGAPVFWQELSVSGPHVP